MDGYLMFDLASDLEWNYSGIKRAMVLDIKYTNLKTNIHIYIHTFVF